MTNLSSLGLATLAAEQPAGSPGLQVADDQGVTLYETLQPAVAAETRDDEARGRSWSRRLT